MTIEEAVELYNHVNYKIYDIDQILSRIQEHINDNSGINPRGYYEVGKYDLIALNTYLREYEEMLKGQLDEVFEK